MAGEMVRWLYDLQHFGIKLGLDNIRALLALLGSPERAFRSVHVAGTNGKGSVAAMIDAMLAAHGARSGLFTSPHLVRPNERIRIAGDDITDEELERRLGAMRSLIEAAREDGRLEAHPSFFEVMTATALDAFRDHALDAAVLEVGLGGRLDATNAVDADVGVIVSIALDHTKTLGPTLEKIAAEKGGIIKPGQPVIGGVTAQRAVDVLIGRCREVGAQWIDARLAVRLVDDREDGVTLRTTRASYPGLALSLAGRHQIDNARVALAAFETIAPRLSIQPDPHAVRRGLARARWPGRLQLLPREGTRPPVLLDAAHNVEGMETLIDYLRRRPLPRPVLLFGATTGKPLASLLESLSEFTTEAVLTCPPVRRGVDPVELDAIARPFYERVEAHRDPEEALQAAFARAGSDGSVLITGSLYLVGEVLGLLSGTRRPGPVAM